MSEKRTPEYRKDPENERRLEEINNILEPIERSLVSRFTEPKKPIIFIVGAPRSATTLVHQLVAQTGLFGYISNYLARFWKAPYFGALQEKAFGIRSAYQMSYKSNYGRTTGWHEPHQFNYFWQQRFQFDKDHQMKQEIIDKIDINFFRQEIAALEDVLLLPMVFKSLYCGLQIPFLKKALKRAKFVICIRNPLYQAQSILLGRKSFFGNYKGWFSLKPKEYPMLKLKDEYEQVIGQIYYILRTIEEDLKLIDPSDYIVLSQENLVLNPEKEIKKIIGLAKLDTSFEIKGIPNSFENRNKQILNNKEWLLLEKSIKSYFSREDDLNLFRESFK
ncbi:MAG: sulfotransferase [Promethearchaeota archaeon]